MRLELKFRRDSQRFEVGFDEAQMQGDTHRFKVGFDELQFSGDGQRFNVGFDDSQLRGESQRFKVGFDPPQLKGDRQRFNVGFGDFQTVTELVGGDLYAGPYEVVPLVTSQTLETKHKTMTQDLTICEIPYAAVSNTAGGLTATIA